MIRVKTIRSDNGGEFIDKELQSLWTAEDIHFSSTVAYTHNQNGVVERANRDIVSHAVSVLEDAKLPMKLWFEVSRTIMYLKNLWPHNFLKGKTPWECII